MWFLPVLLMALTSHASAGVRPNQIYSPGQSIARHPSYYHNQRPINNRIQQYPRPQRETQGLKPPPPPQRFNTNSPSTAPLPLAPIPKYNNPIGPFNHPEDFSLQSNTELGQEDFHDRKNHDDAVPVFLDISAIINKTLPGIIDVFPEDVDFSEIEQDKTIVEEIIPTTVPDINDVVDEDVSVFPDVNQVQTEMSNIQGDSETYHDTITVSDLFEAPNDEIKETSTTSEDIDRPIALSVQLELERSSQPSRFQGPSQSTNTFSSHNQNSKFPTHPPSDPDSVQQQKENIKTAFELDTLQRSESLNINQVYDDNYDALDSNPLGNYAGEEDYPTDDYLSGGHSTLNIKVEPAKGDYKEYEAEKKEEEEEEEEPDRLAILLRESVFTCVDKKDGYYADEKLHCEVFHFCQDKAKHSWLCPNGASFHQVHLICMPQSDDNICEKSSQFHFVNDFLYKEVASNKSNDNKAYADRYYPEGFTDGIAKIINQGPNIRNIPVAHPIEDSGFQEDSRHQYDQVVHGRVVDFSKQTRAGRPHDFPAPQTDYTQRYK